MLQTQAAKDARERGVEISNYEAFMNSARPKVKKAAYQQREDEVYTPRLEKQNSRKPREKQQEQ